MNTGAKTSVLSLKNMFEQNQAEGAVEHRFTQQDLTVDEGLAKGILTNANLQGLALTAEAYDALVAQQLQAEAAEIERYNQMKLDEEMARALAESPEDTFNRQPYNGM